MLLALSMPVLSLAQSDPDSAWAPEVPWEPIPSVESMGEIRPLFFEATGKNLGNRLMGGWFETPTGPERTVAFWNEDTWYPWGGPVPLARIQAVTTYRGVVHVGGWRDPLGVSGLFRFFQGEWHPVTEAGLDGPAVSVVDMTVHDDRLAVLVHRGFDIVTRRDSAWVAFIDRDTVETLTLPAMESSSVSCIESFGDSLLLVGGRFQCTDLDSARGLVEWDGVSWRGSGIFDSEVLDLETYEGDLVVGGRFGSVNGATRSRTARRRFYGYRGQYVWEDFVSVHGAYPSVTRMAVNGEELAIIGVFESVDGLPAWNVARYEPYSGRPVGSWGDPDRGRSVAPQDVFYHQGMLHVAAHVFYPDNGIASVLAFDEDDRAWRPVPDWGFRPLGQVTALHDQGGDLWVSARFQRSGTLELDYGIGRLRRGVWTEMARTDGPVECFAEHAGRLYVGGEFQTLDGIDAAYIGWWDGSRWWPVPGRLNDTVYAMASYKGDLYVAGAFDMAGEFPVGRIVRLLGARWDHVGGGVTGGFGRIFNLVLYNGELVASGRFNFAGHRFAGGLAAWNGSAWRPLLEGVEFDSSTPFVRAVSAGGSLILRSSDLVSVNGVPSAYLAAYDGDQWRSYWKEDLGYVGAMGSHRGRLVLQGDFEKPGDVIVLPRNIGIATWDGARLERVGDTLNSTDWTVFLSTDDALYVGSTDDALVVGESRYRPLAAWHAPRNATGAPPVTLRAVPNPIAGAGPLRLQWSQEGFHEVTLDILDVQGRRVSRVLQAMASGGPNQAFWRLIDDRGVAVPAGVYFARLRIGAAEQVTRIVVTR